MFYQHYIVFAGIVSKCPCSLKKPVQAEQQIIQKQESTVFINEESVLRECLVV